MSSRDYLRYLVGVVALLSGAAGLWLGYLPRHSPSLVMALRAAALGGAFLFVRWSMKRQPKTVAKRRAKSPRQ